MPLSRRALPRRALPVVVVTAVLGGTLAAVHAVSPAGHESAAPERSPEAQRFLDLTGGGTPSAASEVPVESEPGTAAAAAVADSCRRAATSTAVLPNGWCLSPAGRQVNVLRFPLGLTATSHGTVVASSNAGGVQGLTSIDTASLAASVTPGGNLFMGVAETSDGRVYAAGGNANRVFRYRYAGADLVSQDVSQDAVFPVHNGVDGVVGRLGGPAAVAPAVDGVRVTTYPGPLARFGGYVLASGTLSEAGSCPTKQPVCGYLSVIDSASDTVVGRVALGRDPLGIAVDAVRKLAYVVNWADEAGRGAGVGTVSVVSLVNPKAPREIAVVRVGHHPSAVQLSADRRRLFVANTNDDSVSVVDVVNSLRPRVAATQSVRPLTGMPVGAHPDALALSPDGRVLFVALAGMNAVEVRDGRTGARLSGQPLYIPTGWYPSALAVTGTAKAYRLWVANAKGNGFGPGYNGSVLFSGGTLAGGETSGGSVSVIDLPAPTTTARAWTAQVRRNDQLDEATASPCAANRGVRVSTVLCPPKGKRSPLKHMVFVVTENKTFDQYFGDLPTGDGGYDADPTYAIYGQPYTPNHHKLAGSYSLGDSFYSDAEVSVTGHSWTSGAIATDHNERTWHADYDQGIRGSHGNNDPLKGGLAGAQGQP